MGRGSGELQEVIASAAKEPLRLWNVGPSVFFDIAALAPGDPIDVLGDDDLCIPGYEYHFLDDSEDPPVMFSQIPEGFAGPAISRLKNSPTDNIVASV